VVPSFEATYKGQRTQGVIAGRSHVEVTPKYGGEFKAGDIIRLEIPAQAWVDPSEFYIHFQTAILAGADNRLYSDAVTQVPPTAENVQPYWSPGGYAPPDPADQDTNQYRLAGRGVQFQPGIQTIFNRVRLLAGNVVLEDIQNYNVLYRALLESTTDDEWRKTDGFHEEGWYDPENPEQRTANHNFHTQFGRPAGSTTNTGHFYTIRPLIGLFHASKYLPVRYMGQLTLEFYLETPQECMISSSTVSYVPSDATQSAFVAHTERGYPGKTYQTANLEHLTAVNSTSCLADCPNASYLVRNVRMHVPFVHPTEEFDAAMMQAIEEGSLAIHHATWTSYSRNVPKISRQTLAFQERAQSVKGALAVMRNSNSIRDIRCDMAFAANGIEAYQWKIGQEYIPSQEIDCTRGGGRALAQLNQLMDTFGNPQRTSLLKEKNFLPHDLPSQLENTHPSELKRLAGEPSKFIMALDLEKSKGQASGFDSAASSVDIELIMKLRSHVDIVGTDANYKFNGALAAATWQPTKFRCLIPGAAPFNQPSAVSADFSQQGFYNLSAESSYAAYSALYADRPEGFMVSKEVASTYTPATANYTNANYSQTLNETGLYAQVNFFAHVDQVLRLRAVGRMEIVR
jgi:hypothetical protein